MRPDGGNGAFGGAPYKHLHDLPLLPSHILGLQGLSTWARHVLEFPRLDPWLRQFPFGTMGPCAMHGRCMTPRRWSSAAESFQHGQRSRERPELSRYLAFYGLADIVFVAAGNCGQFCPDPRVAPRRDRPELRHLVWRRSTTSCPSARFAATRSGSAIRRRGRRRSSLVKPDLCAPSQFAGPAVGARPTPASQPVRDHGDHGGRTQLPCDQDPLARSLAGARYRDGERSGQRNGAQPARRIRAHRHPRPSLTAADLQWS